MKSINDQDHYQLLEVARNVSFDEVERAYRVVRETYDKDSLALYSVFGSGDAAAIREQIEEAYRVLHDPSERDAYDLALSQAESSRGGEGGVDIADSADPGGAARSVESQLEQHGILSEAFREIDADVEERAGDFDGAKLRRARLRRGFELDQIAHITKVSTTNLRHIEDENFEDLPATVYVRGFVTAYARTIGLDPARVVSSYLGRVEGARSDQARGRFLARR